MAELDDRGRDAADGLLAKVTAVARAEAARAVTEKLNNVVEGGRLNWEMLTQWGHRISDNGTLVPIRPNLDLVGFTVADVPAGDLTRVTGGGGSGGVVLIDSHTCTVDTEATITLTGVTNAHASLVLEGRVRFTGTASHGGLTGRPLGLEINDLGTAPTLRYVLFRSGLYLDSPFYSVQPATGWPLVIAIVPGSDLGTRHWASFSHRFTAPRHTSVLDGGDDLFHHFHGKSFYTAGTDYLQIDHSGCWGVYPYEPINSLKLYAYEGLATFEVGSEVRLWGYPDAA